jgi:diadenosine tetraphosphatase ApaH/serine/threonine PP2A family protein phosphatase
VRYAIISDIHSNLEALEAVRTEIAGLGADKVLCLGDIVGYGASPAECIAVVRQLADIAIAGNHDFGVAGLTDIRYFNSYARRAVLWTAGVLKQAEVDYLRDLPLAFIEGDLFRAVHATPSEPSRWEYIFGTNDAANEFGSFPERLCFVGHTHQPVTFEADERGAVARLDGRAVLAEGRRYLINVGSVGQPRDGDPRACLCLYDSDAQTAEVLRVAYDVEAAKRRILQTTLPPVLADRLSFGE